MCSSDVQDLANVHRSLGIAGYYLGEWWRGALTIALSDLRDEQLPPFSTQQYGQQDFRWSSLSFELPHGRHKYGFSSVSTSVIPSYASLTPVTIPGVAIFFFLQWALLIVQMYWVCEKGEDTWKHREYPQCVLGEAIGITQVASTFCFVQSLFFCR